MSGLPRGAVGPIAAIHHRLHAGRRRIPAAPRALMASAMLAAVAAWGWSFMSDTLRVVHAAEGVKDIHFED